MAGLYNLLSQDGLALQIELKDFLETFYAGHQCSTEHVVRPGEADDDDDDDDDDTESRSPSPPPPAVSTF